MKKLFTIACVALGTTTGIAQTQYNPNDAWKRRETDKAANFQKHVRQLLTRQQGPAKLKTTGATERVVAESSYDIYQTSVPNIYDTTQYKYSGYNGSSFDFNTMSYNSSYDLSFNPYDYPYDWSELDVKADTVRYWSKDSATAPLTISEMTTGSFNTNKKLTSYGYYYYDMGMADGVDLYVHTYNAQGKIASLSTLTDNGSGFDSVEKIHFYYDAMGRLERDSIFEYINNQWGPTAAVKYTYDGAGNITDLTVQAMIMASPWTTVLKYENSFYSSNKLKTSTGYTFNGTSLSPDFKDSIGYGSNSSFSTLQNSYMWDNGTWMPMYQMTKHLNAQGIPDTVYQGGYDNISNDWTTFNKTHYTYTGFGNPQQGNGYYFNGTSWAPGNVLHFYYEGYNDPTSVPGFKQQARIKVYPNPATTELKLHWNEGKGHKVNLSLVNASGQQVYKEAFEWKEADKTISVKDIAPGMYWLMITNEQGSLIQKQGVLKQ